MDVDEITRVPPVIASTILVNQTLRDDRGFMATIRRPTLVLFHSDDANDDMQRNVSAYHRAG